MSTKLVWQCRRANCIRWLNIYDGASLMNTLPSMVLATMFGSQCGSLQALSLELQSTSLLGTEIAAVAALTRLKRLEVCM